jgi:hypothetical protein
MPHAAPPLISVVVPSHNGISLWLLAFPNIYYNYRRKHVYYYRV